MKTCSKCGGTKPLAEFNKNKSKKDGLGSWCRPCTKAYQREYRDKNPDKVGAYWKNWYEANREGVLAYHVTYFQENKESIYDYRADCAQDPDYREHLNLLKKRYADANRDVINEKSRAKTKANPGLSSARTAAWAKRNRERRNLTARAANSKRRALKLENTVSRHYTSTDVRAIYQQQEGCCFYCGSGVGYEYHVDHYIPLARGGSNSAENIRIACRKCNGMKSDKMPWEFMPERFSRPDGKA